MSCRTQRNTNRFSIVLSKRNNLAIIAGENVDLGQLAVSSNNRRSHWEVLTILLTERRDDQERSSLLARFVVDKTHAERVSGAL